MSSDQMRRITSPDIARDLRRDEAVHRQLHQQIPQAEAIKQVGVKDDGRRPAGAFAARTASDRLVSRAIQRSSPRSEPIKPDQCSCPQTDSAA